MEQLAWDFKWQGKGGIFPSDFDNPKVGSSHLFSLNWQLPNRLSGLDIPDHNLQVTTSFVKRLMNLQRTLPISLLGQVMPRLHTVLLVQIRSSARVSLSQLYGFLSAKVVSFSSLPRKSKS